MEPTPEIPFETEKWCVRCKSYSALIVRLNLARYQVRCTTCKAKGSIEYSPGIASKYWRTINLYAQRFF